MSTIPPELLEALKSRLNLGRAAVYRRIAVTSQEHFVTVKQAALMLAIETGIPTRRWATADELAELRSARAHARGTPVAPAQVPSVPAPRGGTRARAEKKSPPKKRAESVFVVHGWDIGLRDDMFNFLRAVGLEPMEWEEAAQLTKKASPYIGEILQAAFKAASAIVVILSPDEIVEPRKKLIPRGTPRDQRVASKQARPNVLFEAGLAYGHNPNATILVEVGKVRPFSDVMGRHVIRMNGSSTARNKLVSRLKTAGCKVDTTHRTDWLSVGKFKPLT